MFHRGRQAWTQAVGVMLEGQASTLDEAILTLEAINSSLGVCQGN